MKIKQKFKKIMKINAVLICTGLILGLCSFAPTITAKTVFKTLAFDKKMSVEQDFAGGQFNDLKLEKKDGGVEISSLNGKKGVYISPTVQAPFKATHIGLHWEEELTNGSLINTYLRTSNDGENFGEWIKTTAERDMGKDGVDAEETFAALVGVGKTDFAQAKIEFIPKKGISPKLKGLTFTFLNSADESETTKKISFVSRSAAYGVGTTKTSPNGQSINVISREDWDANESYRSAGDGSEEWTRSYHGTRKLVIHHTADASSNDETNIVVNAETVRNIYYYHAITQGWGDIGYNALVDAAGNIYEGRYGTHNAVRTNPTADEIMVLDIEAGHVSSYNSGSFGISALGDFTNFDTPEAQISAMEDVLAYVADSRGIDSQGQSDFLRYDDSWHYDLSNVFAHRDAGSTACPGDGLYAHMESIKTNVANRMIQGVSGLIATADLVSAGGMNISGDNIGSSTVTVNWDAFAGATEYEYMLEKVFGIVNVASTSEPWDVTWFYPENLNVASTSNTSVVFDKTTFDDESEYVFYVRALDNTGTPISSVSYVDFLKNKNEIIVDNLTDSYTNVVGIWSNSTNVSGFYARDYQTHAAGNGSNTFEWAPNIFKDGYYDVAVMYTAAFDRDRNVPYTVFYKDESGVSFQETVIVSQKVNGGTWVHLGNYYFERDGVVKVQLSDDIRRGYVIADAVKFIFDRPANGTLENQPPVADAGTDQNVLINTTVSFDGSGSTDDGTISYEWNFGNTATSSGVTSTHTYTATGTYTVTLTVTDDEGLTDEDAIIVTVSEEVVDSDMKVASIDMALKNRGVFVSATALITIVDAEGIPVDSANVSGSWSGLTNDTDSAVTDINGQVTVESDFVKNASSTYIFTVYSVVKSGWVYDSASNVETSDSITVNE